MARGGTKLVESPIEGEKGRKKKGGIHMAKREEDRRLKKASSEMSRARTKLTTTARYLFEDEAPPPSPGCGRSACRIR